MLSSSWAQYKQGFNEVLFLIKKAERANSSTLPDINLTEQQILLRTSVILLAGHVEHFFKSVGEEIADTLGMDWNSLSIAMKRYMVLQARDYLLIELQKEKYSVCGQEDDIADLHATFNMVQTWLNTPKELSISPHRRKLEYYYRGSAPKAIDKFLRSLRSDGKSFFGWIEGKGFDKSRFWTVLDELVAIRNQIVHYGSITSPSIHDARLYLATATKIVRQVILFLR